MTLSEYLRTHRISQRDFARRLGVTQTAIWRYASRERVPSARLMSLIVDATGGDVTPNDFFTHTKINMRKSA